MDISIYLREKDQGELQKSSETAVTCISTPHKKDEEFFWQKLAEIFDRQMTYVPEREKTKEESIVISCILSNMKEFVEIYGGTYVDYQPKHIHVIDPKKLSRNDWKMLRQRKFFDGEYISMLQAISITLYKYDDLITFANVIAHELFHGNAFQSAHVTWADDDEKVMKISCRRIGMKSNQLDHQDHESQYFRWLDEAITQELTERFVLKYLINLDVLQDAMRLREHFLTDIDKEYLFLYGYCRKKVVKGHFFTKYGTAEAYPNERRGFNDILDDIVEKMSDRFPTREDAFRLFAKSYFDGNVLPVALVIDEVYEKGIFHELAVCEEESLGLISGSLHIDS